MQNMMKYFFDVSFLQDKYIYNEFEDKLLFIFSKFVAANDTNITTGITGLCAALSAEYLTHVRQGGLEQGKNYLASIKYLAKILDKQISPQDPPLLKAMLQARKIHVQEKFNRILIDLAKRQRESFDMMDMACYYPAYPFWPHKDLSETISNYMEKVISYETKMQSLRKDRYWFKELFVEITRQLDNESYSTEEIKFFAENTFISLKMKYIEKYIKYYNDRGLKTINNSQRYIFNEINIDEFIKKNIDINDIDKNKYYEFCSVDHMMAIVIEKNSNTGKIIYTFFDPNNGVIQIENKDIFIEFLNYIVKTRQDAYNFIQLRDGNIGVFISEMEYDEKITEQAILPKLDENLINITTNKILCENQNRFILDLKTKIIFKNFNDDTRTTLIELISEKHEPKRINILMDSLSVDEILIFFTSQHKNILALSDNNLHIRLTNENYQIRKIINGSDIIYRLPNSRELLEFYLTNPIATLPREQMPVQLLELHNNELLGDDGENELKKWWQPKVNSELISAQNPTAETRSQSDDSNYNYNIVIQLESDEITNKATANLIAKHPNNTILIQYDLENDQHRVVYGDINQLAAGNSRWLLIGHGRFDKQKQQRLFAKQHADEIVDKLKVLKTTLLNDHDPEKILLLGCKLDQGNLLDNFALNISLEFWHQGFKSTIVAYTQDLFINHHGRKQVYLSDKNDNKLPAKYYKNQYRKNSNSGEITINGETLILSLLRQINSADITLSTAVTRYRDYLSQYFYYPNGELDLDLLKKIAYDAEAYKVFTDNFIIDERIINNYDIGVLINNLHEKNINSAALWPKVNTANIIAGSSPTLDENRAQIIFRFSGDQKFRQQAELLAKELPENTFIFQIDKDSNKAILEYGELAKLNNTEIKKWLLLGNIVISEHQSLFAGLLSAKLVDILAEVKLYFGLNNPAEVVFFSHKALGQLANPYDPSGIASETAINLARRAINATVTIYQQDNHQLFSLLSDNINQYYLLARNNESLSQFNYNNEINKLYLNNIPIEQHLLMDIVTDKIDINKNSHKYNYHLMGYLTDENDLLDMEKIKQIKYDPLLNKKVNNYFKQKKYIGNNALIEWRKLFLNSELPTIQQQAYEAKILLENIAYRPEIIHSLSDYSNNLLSQLFMLPDGSINIRQLMILIHDHQLLENFKGDLIELAGIDKRSELSQLPLSQALAKSQQWHRYYFNNIVNIANRTDKKSIPSFNITINPISHAFHFEKNTQLEKILGLFYAYNENNTKIASELLKYHHNLLDSSSKRLLTDEELKFLENFNSVFNSIDFLLAKDQAVNEKNNHQLAELSIGRYLLAIDNHTFTILLQKKTNDFYNCIIFDPKMGEIRLDSINKENCYQKLLYFLRMYLDDEIIIDNQIYHRYEMLGITKDRQNNYQFKLYEIEDDATLKYKLTELIEQLPIKETQSEEQVLIRMGEIDIPITILQQAGAYIENKKLTLFSIRNITDWQNKLRFDVVALNDYLSFYQPTKNNIDFIKILKQKLSVANNYQQLLINSDNLNDFAVIMQRLANIDSCTEQQILDRHLPQKLQQGLAHLPRYASFINKLSHTMLLVSVIQLISLTQSIIMQLNNINLTDDERKILEDNLIVAWAADITNFGTQAMQPLLFKAAYRMRGVVSAASAFASRVSAGITLAAAGFDLYYAYENFSQLNGELDPAVQQDLIINGTIALLNAGISVSTALAIFTGSSSAGPIGVAVGTGLMVGGMFYNSYRTVERIKEKIALTTPEILQVGFATALGLRLQYSVRNKLLKQQTESAVNAYRQQQEQDFFKQILKPHDFNLSIFITEKELVEELPLYHLYDINKNTYLSKYKDNFFHYTLDYLRSNLGIATLPINLWKQQQIDDIVENSKRKFIKEEIEKIIQQYPNRYQVEIAKIKTYIPLSSVASDEILILNPEFDTLVKKISNYVRLSHQQFDIDRAKAIYSFPLISQAEYIYDSLSNYLSKDNPKTYLTGVSFNFANGNDIIVGFASIKNQFICYNGKKVFIGGDKDDLFVLSADKIDRYENKYFNGSQGNDTLYIAQLPYQPLMVTDSDQQQANYSNKVAGTVVNLEHGTLRYLNKTYSDNFDDLQLLIRKNYTTGIFAHLVSIEHVIGAKDAQDLILGDSKENILNGNGGRDILYGFSGKDTLILNNGYANGGDGEDIYVIDRYDWQDYQEQLPLISDYYLWIPEDEQWMDILINRIDLQFGYDFDAIIIIDEIEKNSNSVVNLQYKLDEIIEINLVDNDIHIKLFAGKTKVKNKLIESYTNLILKNVYQRVDDKQLINHEYIVQTVDGFLLSQCLPKLLKQTTSVDKIFQTMYFPSLDKINKIDSVVPLDINLAENSIANHAKNYQLPATMKPMLISSDSMQSIFHGDKFSNYFTSIKKNSYIYFSHGLDIYLIDKLMITDHLDDGIIFDFKEITNSYTNEDIFILILKDHSGYDFTFDKNNLYYQGSVSLSTIKFVNNMGDFYGKIYLLDKDNQYFSIEYQADSYQITPCTIVQQPTEFDDTIFYPKGYSQVKKVNLSSGNDIFTDVSGMGKIIIAGDGNDIITSQSGNNFVIDGSGNDIISTGEGNDIIISTQGNNIIDAGKGSNILAINYGTGDINVLLNEGNNKIFIQGLGGGAVFDYPDNDLVISSRNNNNKITIYDYEKYKNQLEINTSLNSDILFDEKDITLLIDVASSFQQENSESQLYRLNVDERNFINQIFQYNKLN